jgi:peptide/nickel transport system substrate-binding protein
MSKPPFDNKKVREAVAYAIDKKEVLKASFWGLGETVNNQPFINRSRFYIPVEDRQVNLAKAKQLLSEAGYPNGFKTEFLQASITYELAGCEAAIEQLKKIGIEATMKAIDRAPFNSMMRKGEYSISFSGDSERFDWDDAYYMYLHSKEIDRNNWSRYSNTVLDGLLEKGRTTWKWEDRLPIYKKAIEIIQRRPAHLLRIQTGRRLCFPRISQRIQKRFRFEARLVWRGHKILVAGEIEVLGK